MWLCSISRWQHGRNVPFARWGHGVRNEALTLAHRLLDGRGQPDMERRFAMCMTLCVHRTVNDDELAVCPAGRASHLAGPAVEELWVAPGWPELPLTAQRCERGVWATVQVGGERVKLPGDCDECPPCLARRAWETERGIPRMTPTGR